MSDSKNRKTRSDKGRARKPDNPLEEHIQTRLNARTDPRDGDAILVFREALARYGTVRDVIREALIAYGEMTRKGWKGSPSKMELTRDMQRTLNKMMDLADRLSQLDLRTATPDDEPNNHAMQQLQQDANSFMLDARGMMGSVYFADDDDD